MPTLAPILPSRPPNEERRLASLRSLNLLDTEAEERYDRITRLACDIFQVPVAYISLVDENRQWFKSRQGLSLCESSRETSFCTYTILQNEALIVNDALADTRFASNPFVVGEPYVRFYAGQTLVSPQKQNIGTLCLVDLKPRNLDERERRVLKELAAMVEHEFALIGQINDQEKLLEAQRSLLKTQEKLREEFAQAGQYVRSLLPVPLSQKSVAVDWCFNPSAQLGGDAFDYRFLDQDHFAFFLLDVAGHGLGAALLSVSILEMLREKRLSNIDFKNPGSVLEALNTTFKMARHGNKFFTLWYAIYHLPSRTLTYATGGHPQAILLCSGAEEMELLGPPGYLVGAFQNISYKNQVRHLQPKDRLYVFSDGLYEAANEIGERWLIEDLGRFLLEQNPRFTAEQLVESVRLSRQIDHFQDDVSLLRFNFS